MEVLQSLDAKVLGTDSFGLTNYDKLKDDIDLLIRSADGILSPGLYKLWDSTEAGVVFPAASITTPALPQTFKHLRVVWSVHGDTGSFPAMSMRFNSDAAANYEWAWQQITSPTTLIGSSGGGLTSASLGNVSGATDGALLVGSGIAEITNYAGLTYRKGYTFQSQYSGASINAQAGGGAWRTPGVAISTLTFLLTNFVAGSRITVYGEA